MQKWIWLTVLLLSVSLSGCHLWENQASTPASTAPTNPTTQFAPPTTRPETVPTTVPETKPILTGWQEIDGRLYYYTADGQVHTGWLELETGRYFMDADGAMHTGWLELDGKCYYLGSDGLAITGWQSPEGLRRYFLPDGVMATGFTVVDGVQHYFATDGSAPTGWLELDTQRYYLLSDGVVYTGWLEENGNKYYLKADGTMARGCVEIQGVNHYFTSTGANVLLVNPWNYVPEDYDPQLVNIQKYAAYNNMYISSVCYDALQQMLADCQSQCGRALIVSSYRTHEFQAGNYERKVQYYLNQGYDRATAEELAAKVVARPGTSEHQLGLALDIVDASWPYLETQQENRPVQKWLMEHSWEYGFILRYPKGTTDVTGIIYEPWHYRYVGVELAAELHALGLTLEEYLASLS